jgi:hypothetical protein
MSSLLDHPQDEKTNQTLNQNADQHSNNHSCLHSSLRLDLDSNVDAGIVPYPKSASAQASQGDPQELSRLLAENHKLKAKNRQLETSLEIRSRLLNLHKQYETEIEENLPAIITSALVELETSLGTPVALPATPSEAANKTALLADNISSKPDTRV